MIGLSNLRQSMFANNKRNLNKIEKQSAAKSKFRLKV